MSCFLLNQCYNNGISIQRSLIVTVSQESDVAHGRFVQSLLTNGHSTSVK